MARCRAVDQVDWLATVYKGRSMGAVSSQIASNLLLLLHCFSSSTRQLTQKPTMLKHFALLSTLVVLGQAYGGGRSMGGGYGMGGGGYGSGGGGYGGGVIPAAIQSRHSVQYYDVPSSGYVQPTSIEVGANSVPLNILFRSASSNLNVQQYHQGAQGSNQESSSEDEPHYLRHTVKKPVYQEVREIISPYRRITQEIKPVQEDIQTIVARGTGKSYGGGMGYGGGMSSGGYGGSSKGGY